MAKQRRPNVKAAKPQAAAPQAEAARPRPGEGPTRPQGSASSTPPQRRSTYPEAVALYERGLDAVGRHDYSQAATILESVLNQYPEEKELHERVRLYLNICQRELTRRPVEPHTIEERLYASTLALNGGRYDEAITQLHLVRDEDPDNDYALYMLAVAHAQRLQVDADVERDERAGRLAHGRGGGDWKATAHALMRR